MATSGVKTNSLPLPPGSFGLPLIGETLNFLRDPDFAEKREQKYGKIFKTHLLGRPTVVMMGHEANRFILSSHFDHFSWRDGWPGTFKELLGRSLFLQEGEEHKRNRKLLMPAFHGPALNNYVATMAEIMQRYLGEWEAKKDLVWFNELKQMTFEIASVLLLGSQSGEMTQELSQDFTKLTQGLFTVPLSLPWTTYGQAIQARDRILKHIETVIAERQKDPKNDALGLLVQSQDAEGNRLTLEEIKVQSLLMLFAGHETTTSMLSSFCLALAEHPDVLERARKEQKALGDKENISLEDLRNMPYLEQILKEVERLYPPVGGGFRGVVKSFDFNNYHIPVGWQVLYRMEGAHRDPTVYTQANKFDPDRFSPERAEKKLAEYSLVGFGGGPRICLGLAFAQMEMKIFAYYLLRNYTWDILPEQDLSLDPIPTLHPRSGLKVKFALV